MSTAQSSPSKLRREASTIAVMLKAVERGDKLMADASGKIAKARAGLSVTFAIAMDDKILKITMAWQTIKDSTEAALAEYIFDQMRESKERAN